MLKILNASPGFGSPLSEQDLRKFSNYLVDTLHCQTMQMHAKRGTVAVTVNHYRKAMVMIVGNVPMLGFRTKEKTIV